MCSNNSMHGSYRKDSSGRAAAMAALVATYPVTDADTSNHQGYVQALSGLHQPSTPAADCLDQVPPQNKPSCTAAAVMHLPLPAAHLPCFFKHHAVCGTCFTARSFFSSLSTQTLNILRVLLQPGAATGRHTGKIGIEQHAAAGVVYVCHSKGECFHGLSWTKCWEYRR